MKKQKSNDKKKKEESECVSPINTNASKLNERDTNQDDNKSKLDKVENIKVHCLETIMTQKKDKIYGSHIQEDVFEVEKNGKEQSTEKILALFVLCICA